MTDTPTTPDTSEQRITARLRDFVDADGERWFEIRPDWVAWAPTRREAEARSAEVGPHYGWELAAAHRNYELRETPPSTLRDIDDTGDTEGQPDSITNDSSDLPEPGRAAHRVGEFLSAFGDGIILDSNDCPGVPPLYARDLEALRMEQGRADAHEAMGDELRAENERLRVELGRITRAEMQITANLGAERDELRAEVERLRAELADAERIMNRDRQQAARATQGRDEARAEIERLRSRIRPSTEEN